MAKHVIHI